MLTEETKIIEVSADVTGTIFVVTQNAIMRDGVEIAQSTKIRRPVVPGADVSGEDDRVKALAALWTPEQIAAMAEAE